MSVSDSFYTISLIKVKPQQCRTAANARRASHTSKGSTVGHHPCVEPPEDLLGEAAILKRVRAVCMSFPDAYEEPAWVGVRWRVRSRTFAHVLSIIGGKPQAHARAVGSDGPLTVLTLRAPEDEVFAFREMGPPFFFGGWGRDVVGMRLGNDTDWGHVAELLTESYRVMAPKTLAARLELP